MYPQPATATRPAQAPPRPKWQLAGRQVAQEMFYDCEKAKRAGRKVYFVTAGESEISRVAAATVDEDCPNCNGFAQMGLEVVMGGPFKTAPHGNRGNADTEPDGLIRPAWHNGSWWSVTRQMYPCPVCRKVVQL